MPNQYGSQDFQKISFSVDTSKRRAVVNAQAIEGALKRYLQQFQQEGERILRTRRNMDDSIRTTDYYVPSEHAGKAVEAAIQKMERISHSKGGIPGISISSATDATFKTHVGRILNARVQAEVANIVNSLGGFVETGKGGTTTLGLDADATIIGAKGNPVNAYKSVLHKIESANRQTKKAWEDTMDGYLGKSYSYGDYSDDERSALSKSFTRHRARQARHQESIMGEEEATYDRLHRRARIAEYEKRYALENPNDSFVQEQKKREDAQKKASAMATVGIAMRVAATIVAAIGGVISLTRKLVDTVIDIRSTIRARGVEGLSHDLGTTLMTNWEKLATARGFDKDMLYRAAGTLQANFSDPAMFNSTVFQNGALAAMFGSHIADFYKMGTTHGGGAATLDVLNMVASVIKQHYETGRSPTGKAVSQGAALSASLAALSNSALGALEPLMAQYMYDVEKGYSGSLTDWMGQTTKTAAGVGTKEQTAARQAAAESAGNAWLDALTGIKSVLDSILANFSLPFARFAANFNTLFYKFLRFIGDKVDSEAGFAIARRENAQTFQDVQADIPVYEKAASAGLSQYGYAYKDGILSRNGKDLGKMTPEEIVSYIGRARLDKLGLNSKDVDDIAVYAKLYKDTATLAALGGLANAQQAEKDLDVQSGKNDPTLVPYDAYVATAGANAGDPTNKTSVTDAGSLLQNWAMTVGRTARTKGRMESMAKVVYDKLGFNPYATELGNALTGWGNGISGSTGLNMITRGGDLEVLWHAIGQAMKDNGWAKDSTYHATRLGEGSAQQSVRIDFYTDGKKEGSVILNGSYSPLAIEKLNEAAQRALSGKAGN